MENNKFVLNIDTGIRTYVLKPEDAATGEEEVSVQFNPTDTNFAKRLFDTFEKLSDCEDKYREEAKNTREPEVLFGLRAELDKKIREEINNLFEKNICDPVVGNVDMYAMAGGMPIWANILLAIYEEMDDSVAREQKLHADRIAKYTAKYGKNRVRK